MTLLEARVAGFQSFGAEQTVALQPHITLLAGRNNVGKSALLRALQLLTLPQEGGHESLRLSLRWSVHADEFRAVLPVTPQDSGNAATLDWLLPECDSQELEATYVLHARPGGTNPRALALVCLRVPGLAVLAEGAAGTQIGWKNGPFQNSAVAVGQLDELARGRAARALYLGPRRIDQGRKNLLTRDALEPDARNLTEVLLHLQLNELSIFDQLRAVMSSAFPDFADLSVRSDADSGAALMGEPYVYFHGRSEPIPLRLCGTGLEQMLALTVGVLTATVPRLFLIDEPQAYLHPHAERSLLSLLDAHKQHQYVIASHSHLMLRARPLSHARLLFLEDGQTRVVSQPQDQQLLTELGLTAADLWLTDRLLWVEGPSEEAAFAPVSEAILDDAQRATLAIRRMPEAASRFATKSRAQAEAAYRFCEETSAAVSALPIRMRFVFDADEKSPAFRADIERASAGQAVFLPVRELENLFLDEQLIHLALSAIRRRIELPAPDEDHVATRLTAILSVHDDTELYPKGIDNSGNQRRIVRGSRVLDRLWWEFVTAPYDKVQDGRTLAILAVEHRPRLLDPLSKILHDLLG